MYIIKNIELFNLRSMIKLPKAFIIKFTRPTLMLGFFFFLSVDITIILVQEDVLITLLFLSEKILVQLNLTLVTKSDTYSDFSLRSIFRLNNSHYLQRALQQSGLLPLLTVMFSIFSVKFTLYNSTLLYRLWSQNVKLSTKK